MSLANLDAKSLRKIVWVHNLAPNSWQKFIQLMDKTLVDGWVNTCMNLPDLEVSLGMGGIDRPHTQLVSLVPDIDSGTADGVVELFKRLSDQAQQLWK
jgi:hypothetical protein